MRGSPIATCLAAASLGLAVLGGAARAQTAGGALASLGLPAGPGRATAQRLCSQCHTLVSVTHQRHSQAEWNGVISRMLDKGLSASDDELQEVSDYLTQNFGPRPSTHPAPTRP